MVGVTSSSSTLKLFLALAMALMLSCVTAPGIRTTDVAELHYGDPEDHVIEKLGQGNEIIYFVLDGNKYRYRLYTTKYKNYVYALLFMNGELTAVHNEKLDFSKCLNIKSSPVWDQCLTDLLSEMRFNALTLDTHDFSEGIQAEKEEQGERNTARAGTAAIAVPLTLVLPGIVPTVCVFSCGSACQDPGARPGDYQNPCIDKYTSTLNQTLEILDRNHTPESIKMKFSQITSNKHVIRKDVVKERNNKSSIHYYSWKCTLDTRFTAPYLGVLVGLTNDYVKWAWFRYENLPEYKLHERRIWSLNKEIGTYCPNADLGHADAQEYIGDLFYYGTYGLTKDHTKAYVWYSLAASNGGNVAVNKRDKLESELSAERLIEAKRQLKDWKPGLCKSQLIEAGSDIDDISKKSQDTLDGSSPDRVGDFHLTTPTG